MTRKLETVQKNIAKNEAWLEKKEAQLIKKLAQVQKAGFMLEATLETLATDELGNYAYDEFLRGRDGEAKDAIVNALYMLMMSSTYEDIRRKERELVRLREEEAEILAVTSTMTEEEKAEKAEAQNVANYIKRELDNIKIPALDKWLEDYEEAYIEAVKENLQGYQQTIALTEVKQVVREQKATIVKRSFEKVGRIEDIEFGTIGYDGTFNGTVVGENGSATITTIIAGGYNIQRLHYRVLVK